jgi:hypothetical protein
MSGSRGALFRGRKTATLKTSFLFVTFSLDEQRKSKSKKTW